MHFGLAGGVLFLLSIIVTLAILLGTSRRPPPEKPAEKAEGSSRELASRLAIHDFILENELPEKKPRIFLFRERMASWSEEQVKRYWIPLEGVVLDILKKENDRRMEEFFQGIP